MRAHAHIQCVCVYICIFLYVCICKHRCIETYHPHFNHEGFDPAARKRNLLAGVGASLVSQYCGLMRPSYIYKSHIPLIHIPQNDTSNSLVKRRAYILPVCSGLQNRIASMLG